MFVFFVLNVSLLWCCCRIYSGRDASFVAVFLMLCSPAIIEHFRVTRDENIALAAILGALYLFLHAKKVFTAAELFRIGLLLGLAAAIHQKTLPVIVSFTMVIFITTIRNRQPKAGLFAYAAGGIIPLALLCVYFHHYNAFDKFIYNSFGIVLSGGAISRFDASSKPYSLLAHPFIEFMIRPTFLPFLLLSLLRLIRSAVLVRDRNKAIFWWNSVLGSFFYLVNPSPFKYNILTVGPFLYVLVGSAFTGFASTDRPYGPVRVAIVILTIASTAFWGPALYYTSHVGYTRQLQAMRLVHSLTGKNDYVLLGKAGAFRHTP